MRYIGIDIAAEKHFVAVVDGACEVLVKSTAFGEDEAGYHKLFELLGEPRHSSPWRRRGTTGRTSSPPWPPPASRRPPQPAAHPALPGADLPRTQTDAIDALGLARFAPQNPPARPSSARPHRRASELVRHRDRLVQDFGD